MLHLPICISQHRLYDLCNCFSIEYSECVQYLENGFASIASIRRNCIKSSRLNYTRTHEWNIVIHYIIRKQSASAICMLKSLQHYRRIKGMWVSKIFAQLRIILAVKASELFTCKIMLHPVLFQAVMRFEICWHFHVLIINSEG